MSTTRLLRLPTLRPLRIQAFSPLTTPKPTKPLRPSHRTLTSTRPLQDSTPIRKPVGAFRGGLLGFFVGATLAGASVWFYILQEYRVSNEMLGEDVYSLQAAVQRTEQYVRVLEERVAQIQREGKK